jgi:glutathione S-transferase
VHHLGISQSDRIAWLCGELELPYRLIRNERDPVTQLAPPAYRALHLQAAARIARSRGVQPASAVGLTPRLPPP